jgi:hypothetical protein
VISRGFKTIKLAEKQRFPNQNWSWKLLLYGVFATLLIGAEVSTAKPKKASKKIMVTIRNSSDGTSESQVIQTEDGTLMIWKKGKEISKSIVITSKYQITKLGNSDGHFQFLTIAKKEKMGSLVLSLQYNRLKKKYVAQDLKFRPYKKYAGLSYCEAGSIKAQTVDAMDAVRLTEIDELQKEYLESQSIDKSCANLSEPSKTKFFKGLALANKMREETHSKIANCLSKNDKSYAEMIDYVFGSIYNGRDDFKLECKELPSEFNAFYQGGEIEKIVFNTPIADSTTPEEFATLVTHEVVHVAYEKIINSGVDGIPAGDPHTPILCCLENDFDACAEGMEANKYTVQMQLLGIQGIPGIKEYFEGKSELTESDMKALNHAEAAYKDHLKKFFESNPKCLENGELVSSCSDKLSSTLVDFQKNWFQSYCSGSACSKPRDFNVNSVRAVAEYKAGTEINDDIHGKGLSTPKLKPAEFYRDNKEVTDRPADIPVGKPEETYLIADRAREMQLYDPDYSSPRGKAFVSDAGNHIKKETSVGQRIFDAFVPKAEADDGQEYDEPLPSRTLSTNSKPYIPSAAYPSGLASSPSPSVSSIIANRKSLQNKTQLPNLPFENMNSQQQVSALTGAARGTSPYSNVTAKDHNVSLATNLPGSDSPNQPVQRIPFGSQQQGKTTSTTPGRSPSSNSGGAPVATQTITPASGTSSAGAGPSRTVQPSAIKANQTQNSNSVSQTNRPSQVWDQFKKQTRTWNRTFETDPAYAEFRKYLLESNIDIIKNGKRVFNFKDAKKFYSVDANGHLVFVVGPPK